MTRRTFKIRSAIVMAMAFATAAVTGCEDDPVTPDTPDAPAGLTVAQLSLTSVRITWQAVTGAASYTLQRASAANPGVFADVGGAIAATTYDDTGLTSGTAYSYRVAATATSGTSDFSDAVAFTTGLNAATLSGNVTASRTLFADTVYKLSGYVKVQNGATLTVEAGTKIVGDTAVAGSSLWVLRGASLVANGTAQSPIVFTSGRAVGNRKPGDWGGIVLIGNGIINRTGATILTEGSSAGQAENYAGGNNNADTSGSLRYVRIEFAGFDISNGGGQELNSLSMYAVGSGTTVEYVQSLTGLDDSFEWWGGAVDARYLVSYESGDDHFDWSEGYMGRVQFLIALQTQRLNPAPGTGVFSTDPRGFEGDGCDPGVPGCTLTATGASTPYSNPVFANFTLIGPGTLAGIPNDGNGATWRRGTAGVFINGVMARWKGIGVNIRDAWTDSLFVRHDSLRISNLLLTQNGFNLDTIGAGFAQEANWPAAPLATLKQYAGNVAVDTLLGISVNPTGLDWTPKAGSPANTGGGTAPAGRVGNFFGGTWANTSYLGAADPAGAKWWLGWTSYAIS